MSLCSGATPQGRWVVNAPTVADGAVYFGSDDNHVYALDTETGELLWRFETDDVIRSSPTVAGGGGVRRVQRQPRVCLDAETGGCCGVTTPATGCSTPYRKWRDGLPRRTGGGGPQGHALDAMTGEVLWFAERPYPFTLSSRRRLAGDKVYVPGEFGEFHTLDASTGKVVWSFNTGISVESRPQSSEESYT